MWRKKHFGQVIIRAKPALKRTKGQKEKKSYLLINNENNLPVEWQYLTYDKNYSFSETQSPISILLLKYGEEYHDQGYLTVCFNTQS